MGAGNQTAAWSATGSSTRVLAARWLGHGLSILIGLLFMYAGVLKIGTPAAFLEDIEAYRIVSYLVAWGMAFYLPPFEILAGLALCVPAWRRSAAIILSALITVFLIALVSAWARGLSITCGCFGEAASSDNYGLLVLRDLLILGGLVVAWRTSRPPPSSPI
ncbi:MAG: MauE/DoxX family redox-associated membrane protein [Opitutales bacterium]